MEGHNYICNCDDRGVAGGSRVDSGVLSSRSQLPVLSLNYGDSAQSRSWIQYSLGNLECRGKGKYYPSEMKIRTQFEEFEQKMNNFTVKTEKAKQDLDAYIDDRFFEIGNSTNSSILEIQNQVHNLNLILDPF